MSLKEGRGVSSSTFEGQGEKECLVCRRRGGAGVRGGRRPLGGILPDRVSRVWRLESGV